MPLNSIGAAVPLQVPLPTTPPSKKEGAGSLDPDQSQSPSFPVPAAEAAAGQEESAAQSGSEGDSAPEDPLADVDPSSLTTYDARGNVQTGRAASGAAVQFLA
ncbi:MAG: hypothetical protein PW734_04835 [Verrucomicrobium sp.]|nr:hypothetical protein [Verrucomicrobium sp.]